ncbi:MAG: hypothetical protein U0869_14620 [Chloroflexota bacterium]
MSDELERILAQVAAGELSPEDADPIVAALSEPPPRPPAPPAAAQVEPGPAASRVVRILVTDAGRQVVNLRIPMSLASLAGTIIPGLPEQQAARLQQAIRDGEQGTILDVRDEEGSGVLIATE